MNSIAATTIGRIDVLTPARMGRFVAAMACRRHIPTRPASIISTIARVAAVRIRRMVSYDRSRGGPSAPATLTGGFRSTDAWLRAAQPTGKWRHLRGAKGAVNRPGAADDLYNVRQTPRAGESRDDDPSEQRPLYHPRQALNRRLRLQHHMTSTAQSARVALG